MYMLTWLVSNGHICICVFVIHIYLATSEIVSYRYFIFCWNPFSLCEIITDRCTPSFLKLLLSVMFVCMRMYSPSRLLITTQIKLKWISLHVCLNQMLQLKCDWILENWTNCYISPIYIFHFIDPTNSYTHTLTMHSAITRLS